MYEHLVYNYKVDDSKLKSNEARQCFAVYEEEGDSYLSAHGFVEKIELAEFMKKSDLTGVLRDALQRCFDAYKETQSVPREEPSVSHIVRDSSKFGWKNLAVTIAEKTYNYRFKPEENGFIMVETHVGDEKMQLQKGAYIQKMIENAKGSWDSSEA